MNMEFIILEWETFYWMTMCWNETVSFLLRIHRNIEPIGFFGNKPFKSAPRLYQKLWLLIKSAAWARSKADCNAWSLCSFSISPAATFSRTVSEYGTPAPHQPYVSTVSEYTGGRRKTCAIQKAYPCPTVNRRNSAFSAHRLFDYWTSYSSYPAKNAENNL